MASNPLASAKQPASDLLQISEISGQHAERRTPPPVGEGVTLKASRPGSSLTDLVVKLGRSNRLTRGVVARQMGILPCTVTLTPHVAVSGVAVAVIKAELGTHSPKSTFGGGVHTFRS